MGVLITHAPAHVVLKRGGMSLQRFVPAGGSGELEISGASPRYSAVSIPSSPLDGQKMDTRRREFAADKK